MAASVNPVFKELAKHTRKLFPALDRRVGDRPLIYLDSAATALRPSEVIDAGCRFCRNHDGNPHRGLHTLSAEATAAYESTREQAAAWLNAPSPESVVFTRNATYALNLVARGLEDRLKPDDEILLTEMEHHANLVPWLTLAKRIGVKIRYIPIDGTGRLDLSNLDSLITRRTRVVSMVLASNVLGTINPAKRIVNAARQKGALVVVDAAQAIGHLPFDFQSLGADFVAFSAHKCYGPTGLGILLGRPEALEQLEPLETGGDMIEYVDFEKATWAPIPARFEAGTPNASAVVSFAMAIDFMRSVGAEVLRAHDVELTGYALDALAALPDIRILGPLEPDARTGLVSFVDNRVHPHDLSTILDGQGIAVRAGHHCAQPLHRRLGIPASCRASFGIYSETSEVDALIDGIIKARKVFSK